LHKIILNAEIINFCDFNLKEIYDLQTFENI